MENLDQTIPAENEAENNENKAENSPETATESQESPLSELDQLKADLTEQKDKYLRLMAEFENFRRRTAKERLELIQTAGKDVIVSMLEVLDDCDRAEKQLNSSDDIAIQKEGIQLVFNKVRSTLQSKGVTAMESLHKDFNVELHEAITEILVKDEKQKGKVVDEITKGYFLNDKIIRFAKVVVGK
ncbi:MAG: nucleotide exchange factor GrpE [Chitinophagia bacterium]|nr:nucleotide exchange factor GrpE [Chitinophagia bacterium]NCA30692.1 nucleotide exchange factor GrpE [Chitinophagia bacterium]